MKGVLGLLRYATAGADKDDVGAASDGDSLFFSTAFADIQGEGLEVVPWEVRAVEVGARRLPADEGAALLASLWARDPAMRRLGDDGVRRLAWFFGYASVAADRDLIRQDEYGNFMLVLLRGQVAVDRVQPWGESLRLAEARPGDILGEMSLLDSGRRFSMCTTLTDCAVAVLDAAGMDEMMARDAPLAAALVALLARKLSQRLRVVGERLSDAAR